MDGLRDGIVGTFDPCEFDPARLMGQQTGAGPVTETDAVVMAKIWEGPRRGDGSFLWYGLRPGTESWGGGGPVDVGLYVTAETDGKLEPVPFLVVEAYLRAWMMRDNAWDWRTLTFEGFEELCDKSVREMAGMATDDPDLSVFRDSGGKLLLSHGAADELIPSQGTVEYYRRVIEAMGGEDETRSFARLFIAEGDGHGISLYQGAGPRLAGGMTALMKWVEEDQAPDEITAQRIDMTGTVLATRPVYASPMVPAYRGEGDPDDAASFEPSTCPPARVPPGSRAPALHHKSGHTT